MRAIEKYGFSQIVVVELLAALRNFSRGTNKIQNIAKALVNQVVQIALSPPNEK